MSELLNPEETSYKYIEEVCRKIGISISELCRRADVSRHLLKDWKNGDPKSIKELKKVNAVLEELKKADESQENKTDTDESQEME